VAGGFEPGRLGMVTTDTTRGDEIEVMEGDEGEVEIVRQRNVGRQILESKISDVKLLEAVTLPARSTVARAIDLMKRRRVGAVMIVERKKGATRLAGIFSERDLLTKCIGKPAFGRIPIAKVMTASPEALEAKDSLAYALNKMSVGRFRHIPIVDGNGKPRGMLSIRDVVDYVVELIPEEILNLPPEPKYAVPRDQEGP
jgi:CBS domain-containing protein